MRRCEGKDYKQGVRDLMSRDLKASGLILRTAIPPAISCLIKTHQIRVSLHGFELAENRLSCWMGTGAWKKKPGIRLKQHARVIERITSGNHVVVPEVL